MTKQTNPVPVDLEIQSNKTKKKRMNAYAEALRALGEKACKEDKE